MSLDTKGVLNFDLIKRAISFAREYHRDQKRKSGEPYYSHPLEVAYMVAEYELKTDVIAASILHDIVEDTEITIEVVSGNFGQRIAEIVYKLTRDRPDGSKLSVEETLNSAYQTKDREALLIKLFDRIHNLQTLGAMPPEKVKKVAKETLNLFIVTAMYMGYKNLEENIYEICCANLPLDSSSDKDLPFSEFESYLDVLETSYSHQIVSQVFQNVIDQVENRA